ncbi:hypothetical protein [Algoriphagus sp.]|uniref:hypothetical protein n=1 Tax=Algoriphagus sp. TaxID=1872435 RepID=UPI00391D2473
MYIITSNSKLQTPFELPNSVDQDSSNQHYRRSDFSRTLLPEDPYQNNRTFNMKSSVPRPQNSFKAVADQEILDPKKQDVEIVDPKRDIPDKEFPEQEEDDEDQTPEKIVPQEDKYFLIDKEGDIIQKP